MNWQVRALAIGLGSIAALGVSIATLAWFLAPSPLQVDAQSGDQVISHVTVINPGSDRLVDQTMIIRDGHIAEIRDALPDDPLSPCNGCFAMPGLIDAHVHTPPSFAIGNQRLFALLYLAHGVTSVRDVGQSEGGVRAFAEQLNAGAIAGPYMYRCGPVLDGNPPGWPAARVVETYDEGRLATNEIAVSGASCVKVYNEISAEAFKGVKEVAHERGLSLIGHVPHSVGLHGVESFEAQHLTGVPYLSQPRPPYGWDIRDQDLLALSDEQIDEAIAISRDRQVSHTPTLANFSLRLVASDPNRFQRPAGSEVLPSFWASAWQVIAGHPKGDEAIDRRLQSVERLYSVLGQMRESGVDVLAGTDTLMPWVVPGASLHAEVRELARAFGSNDAALEAATLINGRHVDAGTIGELKVGMRADILLLPKDPVEDLGALEGWKALYLGGRFLPRETVDAWVQEYKSHFRGALYENTLGRAVSSLIGGEAHSNAAKP